MQPLEAICPNWLLIIAPFVCASLAGITAALILKLNSYPYTAAKAWVKVQKMCYSMIYKTRALKIELELKRQSGHSIDFCLKLLKSRAALL